MTGKTHTASAVTWSSSCCEIEVVRVEQTFCLIWPVPGSTNVSPMITRILHTPASRSVNNCCSFVAVLYVGYIGFEKKCVISEKKGVFQINVSRCIKCQYVTSSDATRKKRKFFALQHLRSNIISAADFTPLRRQTHLINLDFYRSYMKRFTVIR